MGRARVRSITVDGRTYRWSVAHHHAPGDHHGETVLSFYRERESHRVVFSEDAPANRIVSCGPLWAGHVCDDHDVWVNLFEPAVAARLIQAAVEMPTVRDLDGWQLLSGLTPAEFPASDS